MHNQYTLSTALRKSALKDLYIGIFFVVIATVVSVELDIFDEIYEYTRAHEEWELDELFSLIFWSVRFRSHM